ncbi:MAG: hypothetical protein ABFD79_02270 [Phycisphaerales bacterium]
MAYKQGEVRDDSGNIITAGSWGIKTEYKDIVNIVAENMRAMKEDGIVAAVTLGGKTLQEVYAYTDGAIATLVNSAPAALDTIYELSNALGNDPNFSTTVLNLIGTKAAKGANSDITSLSGLTTALSIAQGGTGATTAAGALANLGADAKYAPLANPVFPGTVKSNSLFQVTDNSVYDVRLGPGGANNEGIVGTFSTKPFDIYTNGLQRVRIDENGNVGIGKFPSYPLDVNGGVNAFACTFIRNMTDSANRRNWSVGSEVNTIGDFVISRSSTNAGTPNLATLSIDGITGNISGIVNNSYAIKSDGGGSGLFRYNNSLIVLYAVDKTTPANYLFAIGYMGSVGPTGTAPALHVVSNNVLTLGLSNGYGTQNVDGGSSYSNVIAYGISIPQ